MNKNKNSNIIKALLSILIVGLFLIGIVGANEVIETFKAKENYQLANYQTIVHYMEAFSEYDLDDATTEQLLGLLCGIADEVNTTNGDNVSVGVYSKTNDLFHSNNEEDINLAELIHSIDPGNRRIKGKYDYYNTETGNYRFLVRIEHDGIFQLLVDLGIYWKLIISAAIFAGLSLLLILFLQKDKNLKFRRIAGIIFIFIWIGSIALTSAADLQNQHKQIVDDEVEHITSLIEFYYRQDIIEHGDEIEDRRAFAQTNIDYFKLENGNIKSIELNENYHDDLDEIDGCLTVTINEDLQKKKNLDFTLSAILFIVLAIILYDKLSERMLEDYLKSDDPLTKLDNQIVTLELINITGNCLAWSLLLPRLMEVARLNFGTAENNYVASIYSAGVIITTVISLLSSGINKVLRSAKRYFLFTFIIGLAGTVAFALVDDFAYNIIAYFMICIADGLSGMLIYFYIAGTEDKLRKDSFLIKISSTLNVGQSIGIIVGGVFGSIFRYRIVLLIAGAVVAISTILLILTNGDEYNKVILADANEKQSFKDILKKKESFLFLLLIIVPLAFYDVYLDYKFPIDIINLGLTTAVISFVSMSGRLISAYTAKLTYPRLKKKVGLSNMPFIYLIGCTVLMLVYQIKASILMIIFVTAAMGVLDSFGTLSYRERFIEISGEEKIAEDDANVVVKVGDKLGSAVGPTLISIFKNAIALPITMIASFVLYKVISKKK